MCVHCSVTWPLNLGLLFFVLRLHNTTGYQTGCQPGCTTGLTTGWMFVYTIQPVLKPAWQPVWQQIESCKRGFRNNRALEIPDLRLYRAYSLLLLHQGEVPSIAIFVSVRLYGLSVRSHISTRNSSGNEIANVNFFLRWPLQPLLRSAPRQLPKSAK